ncbi:MAG: bifunctional pyr operon transcriptional regulator/uracil phosphoribosyltransferase PyrR [Clostridia bacterium]|nr:bifunctional pyr operon transcriptional regulator/uracil phosphoribosyltransferase PyrR [Clostridia bacterium]
MGEKVQIIDEQTMYRSLARMTHEIIERTEGAGDVVILGIKSRGIAVAQILADNFKKFAGEKIAFGTLDVTMKRDDYTAEEKAQKATNSVIPCDIKDKTVIIVDDVLYTGRTARAAIETVFSIARPKAVQLAVLVDRGHREIPIRPDYVGKNIPTSRTEKIAVQIRNDENNGVYIIRQ